MTSHPFLECFFRPRSIAVLGASRDPSSMAGRLFRNLHGSFTGPLFPINPRTSEVDSLPAFPSVRSVPEPIDLAIVAVPAEAVNGAIEDCAHQGVRAMVMITAGFAEIGKLGQQREERLREVLKQTGIRLIGPNCFGILNASPVSPMNATFATVPVCPGRVGVAVQSGAIVQVLLQALRKHQLGVSTAVSLGNKVDLNENDLLEYWEDDPETDVIALYLESFSEPRRFRALAERIVRRKPIVLLKAGHTGLGQRAAGSHTAALATPDRLVAALVEATGVIAVDSIHELIDATVLLANQPLPRGRRVALFSNAGGALVLCADELSARGMEMPLFSEDLQGQLRQLYRSEATVINPVDLVGSIAPEEFRRGLELLLDSDEADAVISLCVPREAGAAAAVAEGVAAAARMHRDKPLLSVVMDSAELPDELATDTLRIPRYLFPESAARSLAYAVEFAERGRQTAGRRQTFPDIDAAGIRQQLVSDWLSPAATNRLLAACRLPTPRTVVVRSREEAADVARQGDRALVLKSIAPGLLHKSDRGGVILNLSGSAAVGQAYEELAGRMNCPEVLVQEYLPGGHELFVGVTYDEAFGHLLAFGMGGVLVELLESVSYRLLPLSDQDVARLLSEGPVAQILSGYRGRSGDRDALRELLLRVSALVDLAPELVELDLNPVKVFEPGQGCAVVDARVRFTLPHSP